MFRKLFLALLITLGLVVALPLIVSVYLSPQDELEKTEAIVVISGGDTQLRVNEGVSLYHDGWAPRIIFSGAAAEGDISNAKTMMRWASRQEVPTEAIILEEKAETTYENAKYVAEIIATEKINSLILVTSPYHQRRAYNEFKTALGENFVIINHSAKDANWRKKNWWEDANARLLTVAEIMKNFYGLIFNR